MLNRFGGESGSANPRRWRTQGLGVLDFGFLHIGQGCLNLSHSGSGCPRVSGANGSASNPRKNTEHMATPAYRIGSS